MEDVNYPIKYAVLELKEHGGQSNGYEDVVYGHIISKCYVLSSTIHYNGDGEHYLSHNVVFPYDNVREFRQNLAHEKFDIGNRTIPSIDENNDSISKNISTLYDKAEDAVDDMSRMNRELYSYILTMNTNNIKDNKKAMQETKTQFENQMAICNFYQQQIESATEDMKVSRLNDNRGQSRTRKINNK